MVENRKLTKKWVNENFDIILQIGYCQLDNVLENVNNLHFVGHTEGVYGWNADIYSFCHNGKSIAIVTGYRPFGEKCNYEIVKEYNNIGRLMFPDIDNIEERQEIAELIISDFIEEIEKINKSLGGKENVTFYSK